ncbi:MAG: type II CRISPR-associated endonuclease Cas1 [Micrococcales bacterium]|nr:type II CRISPR-associated endonuclease Cas1 [Micrococcales bacterium]
MAKGWRVLDCTAARGAIDADRGLITIATADGQVDRVPVDDLAILLLGTGFTITSGAMHRLAGYDAVVVLCDWAGNPKSVMTPWSSHSRIAQRQIAQAGLSPADRAETWGRLVRAKIVGQAATLGTTKPRFASRLEGMAQDVRPGDPNNTEGAAARFYWSHLWAKDFRRDTDGGDRINALLNYGYGILRGHGIRAVLGAGLIGAVGVAHSHRANPFNLVADLMEPFRPAIDFAVVHLPPYSSLKKVETKALLAEACFNAFTPGGPSVAAEFESLAQRFGRFAEGEADQLDVTAWRPNV